MRLVVALTWIQMEHLKLSFGRVENFLGEVQNEYGLARILPGE